jgi:integrase
MANGVRESDGMSSPSSGRIGRTRRRGGGEGSIYRRADGKWVGSADLGWLGDKRRRKVVYGRTQAEVRDKLRALRNVIDAGLPLPDDQLTVGELVERFLCDVAPDRVSASTLDNYRRVAKHHLIPTLGRKKLAALTPMDVQALIRAKMDAGYSPRTVRLIRGLLVQCISQAERWGIVARNVARLTDGPKLARSEGRTLSPLQARQLLDAARGDRLEACFIVLLALGLRKGEALGVAWTDIDLDRGLLVVRQALKRVGGAVSLGDVKTSGSRRMINLPDEVVAALRSHRARQAAERLAAGPSWHESALVFTTPIGTPIDPSNFRRQFDKICGRAGLIGWHPHELRHSAASIMLAAGVPLEVVSRVLGHASIRITADVYGHIMDPQRKQAADAMSSVLWGASPS